MDLSPHDGVCQLISFTDAVPIYPLKNLWNGDQMQTLHCSLSFFFSLKVDYVFYIRVEGHSRGRGCGREAIHTQARLFYFRSSTFSVESNNNMSVPHTKKREVSSKFRENGLCHISTNLSKPVFVAFGPTEIWAFLVFGLFHLSLPRKVHQSPWKVFTHRAVTLGDHFPCSRQGF